MSFWFEYIEAQIDTDVVRKLTKLNDETLRFMLASWVCAITGGMKCSEIPTKAPKIEMAKRLILKELPKKEVIRISGVSKAHYYNLLKEINDARQN